MHRLPRALAVLTTVTALSASITACGSDDPGSDDTAGPGSQNTTTASQMTTTGPAPLPSADGQTVDVVALVAERWEQLGGPESGLGLPTGPSTAVEGGSVTEFERGMIALTPEGRAFVVQGEILTAYREAGGPAGELGFPTSDETTTDDGWISTFEHGTIAFLDGEPVVELG